ncbi:alpha/beta fold hydrolase [Kutzneria chonburiensis]|uniref:Alpha/beta fold hydrolase n=1 Tax=Kutzneria chonburiensis TaxID=1483604 RepID=A0ABV6MVS3_9PSEU|nr:alpha/beta hydrolase [Kutzneria chonburiensis]
MDTKTRGDGPLLLLLHGGGGNDSSYDAVLDVLAEQYTVVTYTQCEGGPVERADEAAQLLDDLGAKKAAVFGSSAGGLVALDLVARHPERLGVVIAHEPPVMSALPDGDEVTKAFHDLADAPDPGLRFLKLTGILGPVDEETTKAVAATLRFDSNEVNAFVDHRLDLAKVRDSGVNVVLAGGKAVAGSLPFRTAEAVADAIKASMVIFPGNHFGYAPMPGINDPAAFGRTLLDLLRSRTQPPR